MPVVRTLSLFSAVLYLGSASLATAQLSGPMGGPGTTPTVVPQNGGSGGGSSSSGSTSGGAASSRQREHAGLGSHRYDRQRRLGRHLVRTAVHLRKRNRRAGRDRLHGRLRFDRSGRSDGRRSHHGRDGARQRLLEHFRVRWIRLT